MKDEGRIRCLRAIVVGVSCLLIAGAMAAAVASMAAAAELGFSVEPADGGQETQKGYFELGVAPGDSATHAIVVENTSGTEVKLKVQPLGATTAGRGGVAYSLPGEQLTGAATWIDLQSGEVTLAAGESAEVPFTVAVPGDVTPGEHVAGIGVWEPGAETPAPVTTADDEANAQVLMQARRVIAVVVRVPGDAVAHLVVDGVEPVARPSGMILEIAVTSDGGLMTKGDGTIEVAGTGFREGFDVGTIVPGSSFKYPIDWMEAPESGSYDAVVRLTYDEGAQVAEWSGRFTVGDTQQASLEERMPTSTAGGGSSMLGWYIMAGIGALVLVVGGILIGRRRAA